MFARLNTLEKFHERGERTFTDAVERSRQDAMQQARGLREEVQNTLKLSTDSLMQQMAELNKLQKQQFDSFATQLGRLVESNERKSDALRTEVIRRPGLCDMLQREHRVVVVGPTILAALLNSLQMGFRTLAIQQRSGEVWKVLGAVKAEFGKFGDTLEKVKRKLDETGTTIEEAAHRSRQLERKLNKVEAVQDGEPRELHPTAIPSD
ncbi:MAG: DNA recombination protein RmuC [Opitutaceae bacterium]|nr:DNA recombination protein RmuC [Opitutaceae bacterium]